VVVFNIFICLLNTDFVYRLVTLDKEVAAQIAANSARVALEEDALRRTEMDTVSSDNQVVVLDENVDDENNDDVMSLGSNDSSVCLSS
jgi:hypothetical protein